jgi:5-methylcytosine-specific restriction endonuclease McrA
MSEDTECPTCGRDDFASQRGMRLHHAQTHGESIAGVEKECKRCGDTYLIAECKADESRYCSDACKWDGEPADRPSNSVEVECGYCGDVMELPPSQAALREHCSHQCREKSLQQEHVRLTCENCGGTYTVRPSEVDGSRYCSMSCHWAVLGRQGSNKVELTCEWCGEEFKIQEHKSDQKCCSPDCTSEWRSEHMSGETHPCWEGGVKDYEEGWDTGKKRAVRIRDQARCQHCGRTESEHLREFGSKHDVHHIQPARTFDSASRRNAMDNLVTLCHGECHRTWEQFAPLRPATAD